MLTPLLRTVLFSALLLLPSLAIAQWEPTGGPIASDQPIYDVEIIDNQIWFSNGGIFTMPVDGDSLETFQRESVGPFGSRFISLIEPVGDYYIVTSGGRVNRFGRNGIRDTSRVLIPNSLGFGTIESFDHRVFIGAYGSVFVSTDTGRTYEQYSTGISERYVVAFAANGNNVFAGTDSGLYRSSNLGANWRPMQIGESGAPAVTALASVGSTIVAATHDGLFRSTNGGSTWIATTAFAGDTVTSLVSTGEMLLAGSSRGVYRSDDAGATWRSIGLDSTRVTALTISDRYIVAGSQESGIYRSTNGGTTWTNIRTGLATTFVADVTAFRGMILAAGSGKIWRTSDEGETWERSSGVGNSGLERIAADESRAFAVSRDDLYTSVDGSHWRLVDTSLGRFGIVEISQLHVHKGVPFVAGGRNALYRFDSSGWRRLMPSDDPLNTFAYVASYGDSLVASASNGVYFSTDLGTSWLPLGVGLPSPTANAGRVFTMGRTLFVSLAFGLYRSNNAGATWEPITDVTGIREVVTALDGRIYAKGATGLIASADSGRTWRPINAPLEGYETRGLATVGNALFTGVSLIDLTFGNNQDLGVWKMPIAKPVTRVPVVAPSASDVALAPNPSSGSTLLSFTLASATHVAIEIHGIDGRHVRSIDRGVLGAGRHTLSLDDLPAGVYRVSVGGRAQMLVVVR